MDQINFISVLFFSIVYIPSKFNDFTMFHTNGKGRIRTESKLHLTAASRLRNNKKVNDMKIVFMKNSDLDMSMFNRRSSKASLFCYPMHVVAHC